MLEQVHGILNKLIPTACVLVLLWAEIAQAVVVEDLYVARVLTSTQSREDLKLGAEAGLLQVLIKVSGDPGVGRNTLIRQSLPSASSLYYQYGFSSTDKTILINDEEIKARLLTLHFDPKAVTDLLTEAGLPIWGQNRPAVLVWIAVDEGDGRYLLTGETEGDIERLLSEHAARRGLPLIFPVMDLEDAAKVTVREVWGALIGHIEDASERYHPDSILTARLSGRKDDLWSGNWSYKPRDRWLGLARRFKSPEDLVAEMVDRMANELASLYAHGGAEDTIWLKIEAIDSIKNYASLNRYVESLSSVMGAAIVEVDGETVFYRMQISGLKDQLREIIELDRKMRPLDSLDALSKDGNSRETAINYRWMD